MVVEIAPDENAAENVTVFRRLHGQLPHHFCRLFAAELQLNRLRIWRVVDLKRKE
jgi:hypothetical protein